MGDHSSAIRERYLEILERIERAAHRGGRASSDVRLVVVSKSQPVDVVRAALEAGIKRLGENYPEEGVMKIQSPGMRTDVEWHMIGHVQSRKAGLVARHFDMLHSLDSQKLAVRLNRLLAEDGRRLPVLLEFNVGGEASKSGWQANDESRWDLLLPAISPIFELQQIEVRGLMSMPPMAAAADTSRFYFQKVRRLREYLAQNLPGTDLSDLSMGTSADFELAVEEGATYVRVGTAILGQRPQ